ncbi:hypothetical protein ACFWY6_45260 [Streptomyces sp. NPDC059037]|uniref:hypothetical protein n=1 Tax=Streptomyces sp. NPDC059037 TaxID=3346710 RepID=UPI0036900217
MPAVVGVFLAYAAGMGLVVGVLTLAVAQSRQAAVARIRAVLPYVSRASGVLILLAGAYVAYYGWYEIRLLRGDADHDPVVSTATRWQGAVTQWLNDLGPWPIVAAVLVLLTLRWTARVLHRRRVAARKRKSRPPDEARSDGSDETYHPVR